MPPKAAAEWVDLGELKPWANNPRKNNAAIAKVAASIKRFGFGAPVLARREDGEIIAGHTRLAAARSLGLDKVPVRYLDLDPAEAHLLALADNKLNEHSEWNTDALADLLRDMPLGDVELAGWGEEDLGKILDAAVPADVEPKLGELTYQIVIECANEAEQTQLFAELEAKGLKCRPLIL